MQVADDLCTSTRHTDCESLTERLKSSENNGFWQYVQQEGEQVESGADVGVISEGVPRVGISL